MQMKRSLALVCFVTLCAFCSLINAVNAQTNEIRIGWQPAAFFEFFYAQQEKLFEKAGLKPIFVKFTSGPPILAAMKSGDIDIAFGGMPPFIAGVSEGLDISLFCFLETGNTSLIMQPSEEITSASQLVGKKIATIFGTSAHWTLLKYLKDEKIPLKEVTIVNMAIPSMMPAFTNKDVDGISVFEPWGVKLMSAGGKPFGPFVGASGYEQGAIYWGRRQWMADNPQTMKMFLAALDESLRAINEKPEAGAEALARYAGMDPTDALKILTMKKHVLLKDMSEALEGSVLALKPKPGEKYSGQVKLIKEMADFLYQNGNITRELGFDKLVKATTPAYMEAYISSRQPAK
ncbi:ABC transporter substrate-binding protein [Bradyrhizobium sp. WSM471]|uniref:ABC transporter substrate-binding protein n=1 Tax=Bradyrhizobium sp. WSM471 TaxID=319017 RepID=UPI00024D1ABB|nr:MULTISPECIES: ABC transporter substrate-binding protein [Bradyrhizobium]EHR00198.1 ABC-type nitrate/sulfonate/bicarbonate transport system, periplasmic component [Bradyrhizobium sp. WSM471]UFW42322.1 ABC transporter substrate-binding protein [Bradyrhizobium canariense]